MEVESFGVDGETGSLDLGYHSTSPASITSMSSESTTALGLELVEDLENFVPDFALDILESEIEDGGILDIDNLELPSGSDCEAEEEMRGTWEVSLARGRSRKVRDTTNNSNKQGERRKRQRKQTHQPRANGDNFEFIEVRIPVRTGDERKTCRKSAKRPRKERSNSRKKSAVLKETGRQMMNAASWMLQEADEMQSNRLKYETDATFGLGVDQGGLPGLPFLPRQPVYHETDLATAMGIDPSERTEDKITARKLSIKHKLQPLKTVPFSLAEEYDIHERSEAFASNVYPCVNYYILNPSDETDSEDEENVPVKKEHIVHTSIQLDSIILSPLRKKRRSYDNMKCYVSFSKNSEADANDNSKILPEGTRLLKPANKLVELVAQAINDSPDGMLQVQQIYLVLQNKYPYFRYMNKGSITSWRSSIRHALYQKWFRKVQFSTDLVSCKGCYWAINRKYTPKEWTMPAPNSPTMDYIAEINPDDFISSTSMRQMHIETRNAVASITNDKPLMNDMDVEDSIAAMTRKDPDPVLATTGENIGNKDDSVFCAKVQMEEDSEDACALTGLSDKPPGGTPSLVPVVNEWSFHAEPEPTAAWTGPSWDEYHHSLASYQPPVFASDCYSHHYSHPYMNCYHHHSCLCDHNYDDHCPSPGMC